MKNFIPPHRMAIIDKLRHTNEVFASRVADILLHTDSDVMAENIMADAIIELEKLLRSSRDDRIKKYEMSCQGHTLIMSKEEIKRMLK